jgi:hypothetical protein
MAIPWGAILKGVNVLGNVATSIGSITGAVKNVTEWSTLQHIDTGRTLVV